MSTNGLEIGKFFPLKSANVSEEITRYNERRFKQMALFYGFAVSTFLFSKVAYRGIIKRRYTPNFYQHNHVPPPFSFYQDALSLVTHLSLLATSSLGMVATGTAWYLDISNFKEFGAMMKIWLGGEENERKILNEPIDEDTKYIQDSLNEFLGSGDEKK